VQAQPLSSMLGLCKLILQHVGLVHFQYLFSILGACKPNPSPVCCANESTVSFFPQNGRNQFSYPYKTKRKIIVLYFSIFSFENANINPELNGKIHFLRFELTQWHTELLQHLTVIQLVNKFHVTESKHWSS
jgi:hypothetical protein